MDNKVSVFKNNDLGLEMRTILNEDGSIFINLTDAAKGLGFTHIAKSGNEVIRWEWVEGHLKALSVPTCGHDDYIPESLFYMLAMKANNESAQKFQRWIAIDVVPAIRKTGSYGGISIEVRNFMEKQVRFNQKILQKLSEIEVWREVCH